MGWRAWVSPASLKSFIISSFSYLLAMLKVIVIGLGPIGLNAARAVRGDPGMKLVGLVDLDPSKLGKTLAELSGGSKDKGPKVVASIKETLSAKPQAAIVTTGSHFDKVASTLRQCIKDKLHVVSSCEEMSFPAFRHKALASKIDSEARKKKVALLGTGVNPGFVMDLLPAVLSSMVTQVTGVKVIRRLDAAKRRQPLQAKVGATMTVEHFNDLARQGKIGHMGIGESVAMIARAFDRTAKPADVKITLDPVVAQRPMDSLLGTIEPGMVCGMRNTARWSQNGFSIELDLTMAVGAEEAQDRVDLNGPVPLTLIIPGATPGDSATVAALINCIRLLPKVPPGLKTMLDVPPATCCRV
jgi:4-hydroxy-tetrahydrodipicolinate reductase